jgi:hypothetical protein
MGERYVLRGELGTHTPALEIRFYAFPIFTDVIEREPPTALSLKKLIFSIAVTEVPPVSQWAETHKIAFGFRSDFPISLHP